MRNRPRVYLALFAMGLVLCLAVGSSSGSGESEAQTDEPETSAFGDAVKECPVAFGSAGAGPCRVVVYQFTTKPWTPIPQRIVVYDQTGQIIWEAFRDGVYLGAKTGLLQYFRVTNLVIADVDSDGVEEAVVMWDSDCAGSAWIQTLEVLDYDTAAGGVVSHRGQRVAGPFGGFEVLPLDAAGTVWRVVGYSFLDEERTSRIADLECRWCPHRYGVAAYTIGRDGLVVDPRWNGGEAAHTQLRFDSEAYAALAAPYVKSSLFNTLASAPPFVVLSPAPSQTISLGCPLRVEFPREMPAIGVHVVASLPAGGEEVLLDDVLDGTAWEPGTSLEAEDHLYYLAPSQSSGRIVLYDPRHPDNPDTTMTIPIEFVKEDTVNIEVFFPNRLFPPPALGVESVYSVHRAVRQGDDLAKAALEQLFRGPTPAERAAGYFTYLIPECKAQDFHYPEHPCSAKVVSLEIADGVAQVALCDVEWSAIIWQLGGIVGLETALRQVRATLLSIPGIEHVAIW